ncbi:hypothetical protein [Parafrankia discariae]|uniref:hypothetical protein n=1 Tax=Parafrankia discariae TaxID=365528 RepID=UPI0003A6DF37|nr:hypothetical protein [Parafrankia discariae]
MSAEAQWRRRREWASHLLAGGQRSSDLLDQLAMQTYDASLRATYDRGLVAPGSVLARVNPDDHRQITQTLGARRVGLSRAVRDTLTAILEREGRPPVRFHDRFVVELESSTDVRPGRPECQPLVPVDLGLQAYIANPLDRSRPRALGPATDINQELVLLVSGRRDQHISTRRHAAVRVDPHGQLTITPSSNPRHEVVVGETPLTEKLVLDPHDWGYPLKVGHTWLDLYWEPGWFVLGGVLGRTPAAQARGHR